MQNQHAEATHLDADSTHQLEFGPFRLDIAGRRLWRDSQLLSLPPKALDLLIALINADGQLVEKDALLRQLWPDTFVSEESLTQSVSALRRSLGDDAAHPQFVATVPRRGYRFIAPVARHEAGPSHTLRLARVSVPSGTGAEQRRTGRARRTVMAVTLGLAAAAAIAAVVVMGPRPAESPMAALRFVEDAPAGTSLASGGALSPDGHALAYVAKQNDSRATNLWLRALNGTAPHLLPGTTGASRPFWSPDSRSLGFFAEGRLKTIELESGAVQTLAAVGPMPVGGSWSSKGVILFADRRASLLAISVSGGTPHPATTLDRAHQESAHRYPYFLPDGDHFLYFANSPNADRAGTYLAALSGGAPRRLLDGSSSGTIYAEPGFLLHVSEGRLLAHDFDARRGELLEPTRLIATDVDHPEVINGAMISASATGLLAYGGGTAPTGLLWFDITGRRLARVESPADLHNPIIATDDSSVLASSIESNRRGTWSVDTARGTPNWLIREGVSPVASPDGMQLAFASNRRAGVQDLYARSYRAADDTLLLQTSEPKVPTDWTGDGRYIVFTNSNATTKEDIWLLPLFGDRKAVPFLRTAYNEMQGDVSPDGRWIAYSSDETGSWEVYLQKFPAGGWKRTISTRGGFEPHWDRAGRQLFFLSTDQHMMRVELAGNGDDLRIGRPEPLFQASLSTDLPTIYRNQFAVTGDGTRFVIDAVDGASSSITVAVNWRGLTGSR